MQIDDFIFAGDLNAGNWAAIGYVMNNSSNYNYCATAGGCGTTSAPGTAGADETLPTTFVAHWSATNIATLNSCNSGSNWTLVTSPNGSQGGLVLYTATDPCPELTPNFARLNTAGTTTP